MDLSDERLQEGIAAYKQGQKEQASRFVKQALRLNPKNERAWLWLSGFVESDEQRRTCLERVLALNPENKIARRGLAQLSAVPPQEKRPSSPPPQPSPPAIPVPPPIPPEPPTPTSTPVSKPPPIQEKNGRSRLKLLFGLLVVLLIVSFLTVALVYPSLLTSIGLNISAQPPSQPFTPEEENTVLNIVYENIAATNSENIDRYMASIHSQSPGYDETREILKTQFVVYDLTAVISGLELIAYSPDEAQIRFVLETRNRSGPDFRDNVINGTFVLRPENGQWKLYDQKVSKIDYFN